MANTLTVIIGFLAKFAGLGNIPEKLVGVVKKIRQPIDKGLDKIVAWLGKLLHKGDNGKSAGQVKVQKDLSMHGSQHTIYAESKDGKITIRMASRLDYLRSSVSGAITQEQKGANRAPLISLLNNILIDLKTTEENLAAAKVNSEKELEGKLLEL